MKTLQEQYNLIKEGKGDKAYFLKNALRQFPDMLSPVNTFEDTVTILKNRSIISEGIGGLVTSGKKQDWHAIFNENMNSLSEIYGDSDGDRDFDMESEIQANEYYDKGLEAYTEGDFLKAERYYKAALKAGGWLGWGEKDLPPYKTITNLNESKEEKVKEPSKEVLDNQKHNFDYKDEKNYDNLFGQEFLKGYYTELKDPKNADKDVEELKAIVAKNLAKDINFYVKDGQFGVKGLGYTTEAPGLGEPKEPKGKFKSSGYGDLKESVLRSQIHQLIKEVLAETESEDKEKEKEEAKKKKEELKKLDKEWKKRLKTGDIDESTIKEALDMDSIKNEGEDAKKKVMERRITNEIVKRKKQIKALETLTELEGNEDNAKKVKELQSEIKKLEGAKAKLHKVKETTYAGPGSADDLAKDPNLSKVKNSQEKTALINKVKQGGTVEL